MPNKQKTTYQKRQRELARQDKQRKKAERRVERRLLKAQRGPDSGLPDIEMLEAPAATADTDPAAG
ncbi:MAG TPA: hypothetical protein VEU62_16165 [Bryobacterales bacterium]|nr:hypothetical protein [Bryobacterales bacterium]